MSNVPQVGGQPLPAELRKLVEGDRRTVDANNLNDAQRKFLWTDTVRDPKNFLRVEVPNEYVEQVSALFASARGTVSSPSHPQTEVLEFSTQGFPFLSTITEDSFRTHLMFGSTNGPKMMLSVWEFQNAGARITLVEEFLNQKVLQSRATLALAVAQQSKCLWKLNWFDAGSAMSSMLKIN
ncbi:hypothetical protein LP420_16150 [Massilia sp. B-10]|nr:hypothetical protein LP420_16150 [Massilia sp. B-10]